MNGYDASVLNDPQTRLLVVVPNWLGDAIMAMPALQVLREALNRDAVLDVLARPGQAGLWHMHAAPGQVLALGSRTPDLVRERKRLLRVGYTHALILPNSFRSALLPRLAGIPHRRGTAGQGRGWMITDAVDLAAEAERHQQWENARLLLPELPETLPAPCLRPPESAVDEARKALDGLPRPLLAAIPGAARGPSKQWPADRFARVAEAWHRETGGGAIWLGTDTDRELCERLASEAGPHARSLAGQTSLETFSAVLDAADTVLANDSGGMHLAAAVGTPVVAVFGRTDPRKTGPLHPEAVVIQATGPGDRRIARNDADAVRALESVTVDQVLQPVLAIAAGHG